MTAPGTIPVNSNQNGVILVPAPQSNQIIRVKGLDLSATSSGPVSLTSGINGTVIYNSLALNQTGGGHLEVASLRNMDCAPGQPLCLGNPSGITVEGSIEYIILGPPNQT